MSGQGLVKEDPLAGGWAGSFEKEEGTGLWRLGREIAGVLYGRMFVVCCDDDGRSSNNQVGCGTF
jgi:hypothetical protein